MVEKERKGGCRACGKEELQRWGPISTMCGWDRAKVCPGAQAEQYTEDEGQGKKRCICRYMYVDMNSHSKYCVTRGFVFLLDFLLTLQ